MSTHVWGEPDADGVRQCQGCSARYATASRCWQRSKRAHWRSVKREPLPACVVSPAVTPEPAPVPTDSPAVWPMVIEDIPFSLRGTPRGIRERLAADMHARDSEGRRKYGVPLQVENGRNAAVDAYQEALDLTVYARQQWERHHTRAWWVIYEDALKLAARICAELMEGGR